MRKFFSIILSIAGVCVLHSENMPQAMRVDCGSWVQLVATPYEDYHFVEWSDHNTEPTRLLQVNEDAHYIAYFAANCEEYANWPVVALYDWLLMLNVQAINDMGYYVSPAAVTWYRVVGTPDDMHTAFPQDDQLIGQGYYLTLAQNLQGTGDYYAVADVSDAQGMLCDGLMRSVIIRYSHGEKAQQVVLTPNRVNAGALMQLRGLNPEEETHIRIYSSTGQLIADYLSSGTDTYPLQAAYAAGCYQVQVVSPTLSQTLRYIVQK